MLKRIEHLCLPGSKFKSYGSRWKAYRWSWKVHKVKMQLSDYAMVFSFYMVPLRGVDAILGVQWLRALGTYSVNHIK